MAEGEAPFWSAPEVEVVDELSSTVWASVVKSVGDRLLRRRL